MNQQEQKLLQQFGIDVNELNLTFDPNSIQRGIRYYRNGRVLGIEEAYENDLNGLSVHAGVQGSGQRYYDTDIDLEPKPNIGLSVSSECSCPVGINCKHGIAVLFYFLQELENSLAGKMPGGGLMNIQVTPADPEATRRAAEEQQVNEWLDTVAAQEQPPGSEPFLTSPRQQETQYHLIYVLKHAENLQDEHVIVTPMKARLLKKGGYGKPVRFNGYEITEHYPQFVSPNFYFEALDKEIFRALQTFERSFYNSHSPVYFLSGDIGELTLKKILRTGRCFWKTQQDNKPLRPGPDSEIRLDWKESDQYVTIKPHFSHTVNHLLRLEQLYYINEEDNQCGLIIHPYLSSSQLASFLNAPAIPKQHARAVSEQLLGLFPDQEVPLPEKLDIEDINLQAVAPVIHLRLHGEIVPGGHRIHIASLAFGYEQVLIQPHTENDYYRNETIQLENHKRYRIERDRATEDTALKTLRDAGFSSLDPNQSPFGILDMGIYQVNNLHDAVEKWGHFLEHKLPELREAGWQITMEDSFYLQVSTVDTWQAELESDEAGEWFELALGFELDGQRINLLPLIVELLANTPDTALLRQKLQSETHQLFKVDDYQWVKLPTQRLLRVLDTLIELYDTDTLNSAGNLEFSRHEGMHYGDLLNDAGLQWKGAEELKALHERLQQFDGIKPAPLPEGLQASLRDYQQHGYDWMTFMRNYQFNGILADDMGLGKTVQTISLLLAEKEHAHHPSLVIAPTSLMSNWRNEAQRFAPDLNVLILQGSQRKKKFSQLEQADLVLTTYPLIVRDAEFYQDKVFHYLILDEAQAIKNPRAKSSMTISQLKSQHRLCLTGTPVENHLGELWSMFHFLMPGYLGNLERFNRLFRNPIEKHGDTARSKQLQQRVKPFMLRRTKTQVASELPEKTEILRTVSLAGKQRDLYETVRLAMDKKVREEIQKKGLARSHIMILDALLKLRQVCCDPRLVKLDKARKVKESAKLEMLMELLPEMVENGNKILLFSQFTTMLGLIEPELKKYNISYSKLTGQTRKREEAISAFQEGEAAVFLISLKAGGTGLNLTAADTVIHYDPWWNPAVEQQATDRAYRIGQDKPVFVYKLLTEETVEEKILALQQKKQALADSVYKGGKQEAVFEQADLMELLQPLQ